MLTSSTSSHLQPPPSAATALTAAGRLRARYAARFRESLALRVAVRALQAVVFTTAALLALMARSRWQPAATEAFARLITPGLGSPPQQLKPFLTPQPDGSIFVRTGDIPEMWIRDSAAQVTLCTQPPKFLRPDPPEPSPPPRARPLKPAPNIMDSVKKILLHPNPRSA